MALKRQRTSRTTLEPKTLESNKSVAFLVPFPVQVRFSLNGMIALIYIHSCAAPPGYVAAARVAASVLVDRAPPPVPAAQTVSSTWII